MADDGGGVRSSAVFEPARIENKRKFQDVDAGEDHHHSSFNAAFDVGDGGGGGAAVTSGVSYNSVPPPLSEFELAKQRAELIAARLVTGAEGKRPRTEEVLDDHIKGPSRSNGSDLDQGYADHNNGQDQPSEDDQHQSPHQSQQHHQHHQHQQYQHPPSQEYHQAPQYYNPQGGSTLSRKIDVPNSKVGFPFILFSVWFLGQSSVPFWIV
jgi:far upstream element-binding protein